MAKKAIPSSPFAIYLGQSLLATLHIDAFFTISKRHQAKTKAENSLKLWVRNREILLGLNPST